MEEHVKTAIQQPFPSYSFDENLREIPHQPEEWNKFIQIQNEELAKVNHDEEKMNLFVQLGNASRVLMKLDEAESYLFKALTLSYYSSDKNKLIQNLIRLAHVYQWKKDFSKAHLLFEQARSILNKEDIYESLAASYHQHVGKFYFDQGFNLLAQHEFELAIKIRIRNNSETELIQSTKDCLETVKKINSDSSNIIIRRAEAADAEAVHNAHMKSINEICSQDHTAEEIEVWGGRPFNSSARVNGIKSQVQFFAVAELNGKVEGFIQVTKAMTDAQSAHVSALYLTPSIKDRNAGRRMMDLVFEYCDFAGIEKVTLISSITALNFYKKLGFQQDGEMSGIVLNAVTIRGYPMTKFIK